MLVYWCKQKTDVSICAGKFIILLIFHTPHSSFSIQSSSQNRICVGAWHGLTWQSAHCPFERVWDLSPSLLVIAYFARSSCWHKWRSFPVVSEWLCSFSCLQSQKCYLPLNAQKKMFVLVKRAMENLWVYGVLTVEVREPGELCACLFCVKSRTA